MTTLVTTEVEHAHSGLEPHAFSEPLRHPERVGRATDAGQHPLGIVGGGPRKALGSGQFAQNVTPTDTGMNCVLLLEPAFVALLAPGT